MNHCLYISETAKEVKVESHVLRYWEEELHLPIKRNELGHRYYTQEDVERFKQIKSMKERGLQLKAIKMILKEGKLNVLPEESVVEETNPMAIEILSRTGQGLEHVCETSVSEGSVSEGSVSGTAVSGDFQGDKTRRLQWLLQEMIRQTIQETNAELCRDIKESVIKELDYQFRMQEEREEARDKMLAERDEAYYKKMDELLRKKSRSPKMGKAELIKKEIVSREAMKESPGQNVVTKKKRHFF